MDSQANVAHVIVNNLGGITSLTQNLILYKSSTHLQQELHVLDVLGNPSAPAFIDPQLGDVKKIFKLYPRDNWYYTYKKLAGQLNTCKGVLISNDQFDLIMLSAFNIDRKVIQIVHDEYNLSLSIKFKDCIDRFIAHSRFIYDALCRELPNRINDIVLMHYGIPIVSIESKKENRSEPLKLVFLGRHVRDKGVFDLYEINENLKSRQIRVDWTILGKGPETDAVKKQWGKERNVYFETPETHEALMRVLSQQDILVFPTKFEGFPVALLESMSVGCMPLVSDIPGGIQEVVLDGTNGYKCSIDDHQGFADKIECMHLNRERMIQMQQESIKLVVHSFDIKKQVKVYQDYFAYIATLDILPNHHSVKKKIGSRLDHPFIPNWLTRQLRKLF